MSVIGKYPYERAEYALQRLREGKMPLKRDQYLAIEALERVIELRKHSRDKTRAYVAQQKQEAVAEAERQAARKNRDRHPLFAYGVPVRHLTS